MSDDAPKGGEPRPDAGIRPSFAKPIGECLGEIGIKGGYSGQEYDAPGQADWRARQKKSRLPESGEVAGSGLGGEPGEDLDIGTPGGARPEGGA